MEILNVILSFVSIVVAIIIAIILYGQSENISSLGKYVRMQTKKEVLVLLQALDNIQFIANVRLTQSDWNYEIGCIDNFMCSTTSKLVADVLDKREVGKDRGNLFLIHMLQIRYNPQNSKLVQSVMDTLFSLSEEDFNNMDKNADALNKDFCQWYRNQAYLTKYYRSYIEEKIEEDGLIGKFFIWLYDVKNIKDPDVELFYAVFMDKVELVKEARAHGANISVTDMMLIRKYQTEYNEFISLLNQ